MISGKERDELIESAVKVRQNAYAPYSGFKVGAAVLGFDGKIFTGCNVENAAYGPSLCAERAAVSNAVLQGVNKFKAIAVVSEKASPPCGVCRQVIFEFVKDGDFEVVLADLKGNYRVLSLKEIFPHPFSL